MLALWIAEILDHPKPAAIVEGEGDRLEDIRLAGEEGRVEASGERDFLERFQRGEGTLAWRLSISDALGEDGGRLSNGCDEGKTKSENSEFHWNVSCLSVEKGLMKSQGVDE